MTYPRSHLVDSVNGGLHHCFSRCVRRAWLCGEDPLTGQSFEHRRAWIEQRILHLAQHFAVSLHGYSVMSNHYHLVIEVRPQRTRAWDDECVARRWCAVSPRARDADATEREVAALLDQPERLAVLRERLGNLSWFMRFLNESIARRANREDEVTGRFWEGRFRSVALLDTPAILACMAYVDLNPVRACAALGLDDSYYTSIHRRLNAPVPAPLAPVTDLGISLESYEALLRWTISAEAGASTPEPSAAAALTRLDERPTGWLGRVRAQRAKYRAYGGLKALEEYAHALGQQWLRGAKPGLAAPG